MNASNILATIDLKSSGPSRRRRSAPLSANVASCWCLNIHASPFDKNRPFFTFHGIRKLFCTKSDRTPLVGGYFVGALRFLPQISNRRAETQSSDTNVIWITKAFRSVC
jgi:hypothetical protein